MGEPPLYTYTDSHGDTLAITAFPRNPTGPEIEVDGESVRVPFADAGQVAHGLLAAAGQGHIMLASPEWTDGQTEAYHLPTNVDIEAHPEGVVLNHGNGPGPTRRWEDALALASNIAHAALVSKAMAEAIDHPAVEHIAGIIAYVEPDLRETYAQDAPEEIARAILAAGYRKEIDHE